jgi:hypothetical protein
MPQFEPEAIAKVEMTIHKPVDQVVDVEEIDPNKRILIEWDSYTGRLRSREFAARSAGTTKITVRNWGFRGEDVVDQAGGTGMSFGRPLPLESPNRCQERDGYVRRARIAPRHTR